MKDQNVQVEVVFDDVRIMKDSYALYGVLIRIVRHDNSKGAAQTYEQHVYRRFSEFWDLKNKLEKEFNTDLPYELPGRRFGLWKRSAVDPEVIEERKVQLAKFLRDMLNDSFDTKWKNSTHVSKFLKLSSNWNSDDVKSKNANISTEKLLDLKDPAQWMIRFKDSKTLLEQSTQLNGTQSSKISMQLRLALYDLEKALKGMQHSQQISDTEFERRGNLLAALKSDVNEMALKSTNGYLPQKESGEDEDRIRDALFPDAGDPKSPKKPLAGRRKFGETTETQPLNNQQLLQLHKNKMRDQDDELEDIRKIVQRQKNLSLEMNQELAQQNDLLDLLDSDVDNTATKLRSANRRAKQFNND